MRIKFKIPVNIYISGPTKKSLFITTIFQHKKYRVNVSFSESGPLVLKDVESDAPHFKSAKKLIFIVEDEKDRQPRIPDIVNDANNHQILIEDLKSIANRVLRNLRNFGIVTNINEIRILDKKPDYYLNKWEVEKSENGENWKRLSSDLSSFLALLGGGDVDDIKGNLNVNFWPEIEEAILDDQTPAPEQEFMTNSIQYLDEGNFRSALIESIICLEIVLSQFLRNYLSIDKEISNSRIKKFLSPDLGLTSRISGLLDLCLTKQDLSAINIDEILAAIKWRNHIIHRTGHLPEGLTEKEIRKKVSTVLSLVHLLARRRDLIESSPEMQEISSVVAEKYGTSAPKVIPFPHHRIRVDFFYLLSSQIPSKEVILQMIDDLSKKLKERDSRFSPKEHLHILFRVFKDIKIIWAKGELTYLNHETNQSKTT